MKRRCFTEEREKLKNGIQAFFFSRPEIFAVYLHGSFLSNLEFSDIDLAVLVDQSDEEPLDYELTLEVVLQENFGFPFDVRILNRSPTFFAYCVIKEGERLHIKDDDRRTAFEEEIFSRYLDFLYYYKQYMVEGYGIRH